MAARAKRAEALRVTVGIAVLVLLADQLSKWLILAVVMQPPRVIAVLPVLNLKLGFNTGVSFGLFSETLAQWPGLLIGCSLLVALAMFTWAVLTPLMLERNALATIAGGAFGNVIDRWGQGAVTDFLDLHWQTWHWPTFNVADIAITVGCALLTLSTFTLSGQAKREPEIRNP